MSRVISLRLKNKDSDQLERLARRFNRSLGETAALLLAEKLKEEGFPFIEFRSSLDGRQAYVKGSSLAVWEVVLVARQLGMDARRVAEYLEWSEEKISGALAYADANAGEIAPIVDEVEATDFQDLKRRLPWLREVKV